MRLRLLVAVVRIATASLCLRGTVRSDRPRDRGSVVQRPRGARAAWYLGSDEGQLSGRLVASGVATEVEDGAGPGTVLIQFNFIIRPSRSCLSDST